MHRRKPPRCSTLMLLALWLAASSATAAPPAPTGLQAEIKIGSLTLNWLASPNAGVYQVYRCPYRQIDANTRTCDHQTVEACVPASEPLAETRFSEVPPKAQVFCYRVKACADASAADCSDFSAGVIGFHKPPRKIAVTIIAPDHVRPGETVTMQSYADSAGTVTEYRWIQSGEKKDIALQGANTATATWVAPPVTQPAIYKFKVMAVDDYGTRAFRPATITVLPEGMTEPPRPALPAPPPALPWILQPPAARVPLMIPWKKKGQ